jgi:hypothetical protein
MHGYGESCHYGKAKWLSKSETDYDYNDLFWIQMAKSKTDYDYNYLFWIQMVKSETDYNCKNPVLDLDTIGIWMPPSPIQI